MSEKPIFFRNLRIDATGYNGNATLGEGYIDSSLDEDQQKSLINDLDDHREEIEKHYTELLMFEIGEKGFYPDNTMRGIVMSLALENKDLRALLYHVINRLNELEGKK